MMLSRHRLRRPFFLEFEFYAALAGMGWAALAFGTRTDMSQRPTLSSLGAISDDQWAAIIGMLAAAQMVCVLVNTRVGRWLIALPLCVFWCSVTRAILGASTLGADTPLATALYGSLAVCSLLKVARLPREFPPRG